MPLLALGACDAAGVEPVYDDAPARIHLSVASLELDRGDTSRVAARLLNGSGSPIAAPSAGAPRTRAPIAWTSSDPSIATVSRSGLVLAQRAGQVTITATSGAISSTSRVDVQPRGRRLTVTPRVDTLAVDHSLQLSTTLLGAGGAEVASPFITWTSLDPAIASVNTRGLVKAIATGAALIVASANGQADTARIEVRSGFNTPPVPAVAAVAVTPTDADVEVGATRQLRATVYDGAGRVLGDRAVVWSSSDPAVATVDAAGLVKARAAGAVVVRATAEGISGSANLAVTPRASQPPPPLQPGGNGRSPHWSHIRTEITDFRTHYQPLGTRTAEYDWNAAHFDVVMNGDPREYRTRNPNIKLFPYSVVQMVRSDNPRGGLPSAFYADMQAWYSQKPQCRLEDAFLHRSQPRTVQTRIRLFEGNQNWWRTNLADSCYVRYTIDRLGRMMNLGGPHEADGVFIDNFETVNMALSWPNVEYANRNTFFASIGPALAEIRAGLGPNKILHLNVSEIDTEYSNAWAAIGGSALLEQFHHALRVVESRWDWVEQRLLARGTRAKVSTRYGKADYENAAGFTAGNERSPGQRGRLWTLTSYYMVRPDAARIDLLYYGPAGKYDRPFNEEWPRAAEYDIGHPREARRKYLERTITYTLDRGEAVARRATIWGREYDRALVLNSPRTSWFDVAFDDRSGVVLPLPAGETWYMLHEDGTIGAQALTEVTLRTGEGAILLKGTR